MPISGRNIIILAIWAIDSIQKWTTNTEYAGKPFLNRIYDIGKIVEKYEEMPDNLRDHEKIRMEALQAKAKEWGEKNVK